MQGNLKGLKNKEKIFLELKKLLKKHSTGLEVHTDIPNSTAKDKKQQFHLYGVKPVSILGKRPKQTYVAGIIMQKNFVGFYSMPMYSHLKECRVKHPFLKKAKKGKSCLNISMLDKSLIREISGLIGAGIKLYKKEGWI